MTGKRGRPKGSTNKKFIKKPTVILKKAAPKVELLKAPIIHDPNAKLDVDKALESLKAEINAETEKKLSEKEAARPVEAQVIQSEQVPAQSGDYVLDANGCIIEPEFNLEAVKAKAKTLQPFARGGLEALNLGLTYVYENKKAEIEEDILKEAVPVVANLAALGVQDAVKLTQKQQFIFENVSALLTVAYLHYKHLKDIKPDPNFGKENANPTSTES